MAPFRLVARHPERPWVDLHPSMRRVSTTFSLHLEAHSLKTPPSPSTTLPPTPLWQRIKWDICLDDPPLLQLSRFTCSRHDWLPSILQRTSFEASAIGLGLLEPSAKWTTRPDAHLHRVHLRSHAGQCVVEPLTQRLLAHRVQLLVRPICIGQADRQSHLFRLVNLIPLLSLSERTTAATVPSAAVVRTLQNHSFLKQRFAGFLRRSIACRFAGWWGRAQWRRRHWRSR